MSNRRKKKKLFKKARDMKLEKSWLKKRAEANVARGFPVQKWIQFAVELIDEGYVIHLYEARRTRSKYLTISKPPGKTTDGKIILCDRPPYKVRFSDHLPIEEREQAKDCDFFVGITHTGCRTTPMALQAVRAHFLGAVAA